MAGFDLLSDRQLDPGEERQRERERDRLIFACALLDSHDLGILAGLAEIMATGVAKSRSGWRGCDDWPR